MLKRYVDDIICTVRGDPDVYLLNFCSYAPFQHKKNVIQGTVHRVISATSNRLRLLNRTKLAGPKIKIQRIGFQKKVNQTLEIIIVGGQDQMRTTPKAHQKAKLGLMVSQLFFYNTEAILLNTLQANWRNYAKCKWFLQRGNWDHASPP